MTAIHALVLACWIAFVAYWLLQAVGVKRARESQSTASLLADRSLTFSGGVLLFWPHPPGWLGFVPFPGSWATGAAGLAACVCGLAVAVWARHTLGANWSSRVTVKVGHELVEHGPYRFVRHPIYTGILLISLGTALEGDRAACVVGLGLLFAGFWIKLRKEERLMLQAFPATYPRYRARVKALVPGLL